MNGPKLLVFDIETIGLVVKCWGTGDQYINPSQIIKDWAIIAWAAKWVGDPASKTVYRDNRGSKDIRNDKSLVAELAKLINEADGVLTQNGARFDVPKVHARAIINRLDPIKQGHHIDICKEGRKTFGFTSHKLEYVTDRLNTKYKKLKHKDFPGQELWDEVELGNIKAWNSMKIYNIHDVLSTEEAYLRERAWIKTPNFHGRPDTCHCGSKALEQRGHFRPASGIGLYARYRCKDCGKWPIGRVNLEAENSKAKNVLR